MRLTHFTHTNYLDKTYTTTAQEPSIYPVLPDLELIGHYRLMLGCVTQPRITQSFLFF